MVSQRRARLSALTLVGASNWEIPRARRRYATTQGVSVTSPGPAFLLPFLLLFVHALAPPSELKERTFSGMSKARHVDFFDNNDCCRPSILIFLVPPFPFLPLPSPPPLPSSAFDINATQGCSNMVFAPLKSPFDCFKACCPGSGYHPDCRVWQYAETQWLPNRRWKQTNPLSNQESARGH